jgi:hypothetical protein
LRFSKPLFGESGNPQVWTKEEESSHEDPVMLKRKSKRTRK